MQHSKRCWLHDARLFQTKPIGRDVHRVYGPMSVTDPTNSTGRERHGVYGATYLRQTLQSWLVETQGVWGVLLNTVFMTDSTGSVRNARGLMHDMFQTNSASGDSGRQATVHDAVLPDSVSVPCPGLEEGHPCYLPIY